jgi:chromosome segregation ATPase
MKSENEQLHENVTRLKRSQQELMNENKSLQKRVTGLQQTQHQLESQKYSLEEKVTRLKTSKRELRNEKEALRSTIKESHKVITFESNIKSLFFFLLCKRINLLGRFLVHFSPFNSKFSADSSAATK